MCVTLHESFHIYFSEGLLRVCDITGCFDPELCFYICHIRIFGEQKCRSSADDGGGHGSSAFCDIAGGSSSPCLCRGKLTVTCIDVGAGCENIRFDDALRSGAETRVFSSHMCPGRDILIIIACSDCNDFLTDSRNCDSAIARTVVSGRGKYTDSRIPKPLHGMNETFCTIIIGGGLRAYGDVYNTDVIFFLHI